MRAGCKSRKTVVFVSFLAVLLLSVRQLFLSSFGFQASLFSGESLIFDDGPTITTHKSTIVAKDVNDASQTNNADDAVNRITTTAENPDHIDSNPTKVASSSSGTEKLGKFPSTPDDKDNKSFQKSGNSTLAVDAGPTKNATSILKLQRNVSQSMNNIRSQTSKTPDNASQVDTYAESWKTPAIKTGNRTAIGEDDQANRTLAIQKQTYVSKSRHHQEEGFAGCLLIMDDNHFLIEWLAYHYQVLPLRRLIIAIDPKSRTSPLEILHRYMDRGLLNITIWNEDADFGFDAPYWEQELRLNPPTKMRILRQRLANKNKDDEQWLVVAVYLMRQKQFMVQCMQQLKAEHATWTTLTDTDEFVTLNKKAAERKKIQRTAPTVLEMLNDPINRNVSRILASPCIPMNRRNVGIREGAAERSVVVAAPPGFNDSDYLTLRWRYPLPKGEPRSLPSKCLVDLSRIPLSKFPDLESVGPHRPIKEVCPENFRIGEGEAAFAVNQYLGVFEQWAYRDDGRNKRTWTEYKKLMRLQNRPGGNEPDNSTLFWLQEFVAQLGSNVAHGLLEGAGLLENKTISQTTRNNASALSTPATL
jgi:hypothetical protein